jgi:hypothetical protein
VRTSIIGKKANFTNYSVTNIIGGDIDVDKSSNPMRSSFFIFSVDKIYTLVVYSSTEVREIAK